MSNKRLTAYLMLLATSVLWGIASPIVKFTLTEFNPLVFLTYRFFLTSLVMLPAFVLLDDKIPKTNLRGWIMIILASLLGSSINLGFLFWGLDNTTALAASVIAATSPVFVVLSGAYFLKESVSKQEAAGLAVALIGSLIIIISPSFVPDGETTFGNFLIVLGNISWVAYIVITKRELLNKVSPLFLTTASFLLGFFSLLPFAIFQYGSLANLVYYIGDQHIASHLGVIYMAIFSGAIAYWLYQEGQKRIEASEATIFSYLHPIFTAPLAIFWLGESLTTPFLIGAVVITTGVIVAEYRKRRRK